MLTISDARRIWRTRNGSESFRLGLARLSHAKLVEVYDLSLRWAAAATEPVFRLPVGDGRVVDCESLSRRLKGRWSESRRRTQVVTASRTAANLFGSTAFGVPKLGHREHDALLGTVFAQYAINDPRAARGWVGEHAVAKAGYRIKDPDAFLFDQGEPYRIVESGGSYGASQVRSLVEFARERELELEVW